MPTPDIRLEARLQHILQAAVDGLPADDRDARVRWCRRTGQHGVTMHPAAAGLRFDWGGRLLALVEHEVFADDDAYLSGLDITMHPLAATDSGEPG